MLGHKSCRMHSSQQHPHCKPTLPTAKLNLWVPQLFIPHPGYCPNWAPISQPAPDISPSGLLAPPLSISSPSFTFQLKQKPSRTPPSTSLGPAIRPCIPTQCHCSLPPGPVPRTSLSCLLGSRTGHMQAPAGIPCRPAPPTPSGLSWDVTSSREPSLSRVSPAGHLPSPPEFQMSLLPVGARYIVPPLLTGL